ncbi:putative cytochrome P450 CYP13A4 [Oppia nitens]|uniref:putative cytochrome P450 CYP13A4 n=1 Tax=Oppia nitens TaxID=1686743 RepID=UPI0023DB2E19|nr:putative cytochrome P450 CYP13A4 [Oppia nitens]
MVDVVGFLNTDTTRWKHLRTKALVFFTTRRIRAIYDDVIDKCSANLVKHLDKTIGYGQPFKLKAEWARYGMDIFLGYAFTLDGHMGNYTDPRQQQQYRELVASGIRLDDDLKWRELIVRLPGFSQRLASWYTGTDLNKSFKQMEKVISAYIVQRLDNRKEGEDVGAADDDDGDNNPNKYDDEKLDIVGLYLKLIIGKVSSSDPIAIRVMTYYVIGNFLALFGSTADILTNISMHLARHPSIQKKLYAEIVEALDKGKDGKDQDVEVEGVRQCNLSFDQLTHLPYMDAVVKESLRISPSAPRFRRVFGGSRDSEAAKILPGIQLEPGTRIDIQISAIHMDDELFPDPYEYNPDRFLTTNANNRLSNLDANSLLTFSLGPQMCCGVRLAFLIVKSFLSHMIYNYQFNVIDIDDLNRPKLCDAPIYPTKFMNINAVYNLELKSRIDRLNIGGGGGRVVEVKC